MTRRDEIAALVRALGLQRGPVGVSWGRGDASALATPEPRIDACRAILQAAGGRSVILTPERPGCRMGLHHLGLARLTGEEARRAFEEFVFGDRARCFVEEFPGLEPTGVRATPAGQYLLVAPMDTIDDAADAVIFVCTLHQASTLMALDGEAGGQALEFRGPLCQRAIAVPLVADRMNVTLFTDAGRRALGYRDDELLVSVPAAHLPRMTAALATLAGTRAPAQIPTEVLSMLQERCSGPDN